MKSTPLLPLLLANLIVSAVATTPSLTIYNQNFAVVRDTIPLELKKGMNEVKFDGATIHLEPDSVILRDPDGAPLQILEQNYRNDPVTQQLLLSLCEGKEVEFVVHEQQKPDRLVKGRVIRSGYLPHGGVAMGGDGGVAQPIIEVDGKIQFSLPGEPLFPSLGDGTILKPQLDWKINVPKALKTDAELGYITGGMAWSASYNVISPEKGDDLDLVGWVTIDNQSGRDFVDARIKLMAGDVNRIAPQERDKMVVEKQLAFADAALAAPGVTEKAFDEYHLYTLGRATTLKDRETKQVEFVRAARIKSDVTYIYDGVSIDWNRWGGYNRRRRMDDEFGTDCNKKVAVMREFKNTRENGLGIPLPNGKLRFYRSNGEQLEFTGENIIDHTPADETVKITTGKAFDLVGERKRTSFLVDNANNWASETFEITLRNHKKESVTIHVVEHLYRWVNWAISDNSSPFVKNNAQEIEFKIPLKPDEEKKVTYKVLYRW